ncbi:HCL629Cp [Eremothecium sinecaudum]|uniref:HCL629Cp n=1 Tax=Eremothecium sinecaudum TaxID=45286 RepID=A0A109UYK4_9SACH|nr:HCL629Cp [Eremothecium sinecaudum]AMD19522.1 HCL629Cp [Eremothecium sinecaudum]
MDLKAARVDRLKIWCHDLSKIAPVVGYYMKLYAVELVLEQGVTGLRETAAKLLDEVEAFKKDASGADGDAGTALVLEDQEKAKAVVLHFAMKMENGILESIGAEGYTADLLKGLWCCIDLFECIIHLWGGKQLSEEEKKECKKRIKFAKYSLTKGKKQEVGGKNVPEDELGGRDSISSLVEFSGLGDMPTFLEGDELDEEVNENVEEELQDLEKEVEEDTAVLKTPIVAEEQRQQSRSPMKMADIDELMDRERKSDEVRRLAKYAISAMNYEDVTTAKRELEKALAILDTM